MILVIFAYSITIITMMTVSRLSSWKELFLSPTKFDYTNSELRHLKKSIDPDVDFSESFEAISKNQSISFLSLDPTETKLEIFHHPVVLSGSWNNPDKKLIALLGHDITS
jgi:hypothetical protein